ncbi:SDR family NAD(P)-dependent oxidoreductase [Micromonospora sp. WMMD961]|uniref:SDR family NAD(P)-dependent oxidoreductase n=1 Tax=Micromonospora sp. WMMD961 TaxID=3016100 RepID=UPI0024170218|nr:SDR family NAD(P)-dependent oxidoreductase [Micromonospora sp. WMMD961]MDG4781005.1 SDR family NAD(P)-dependent oxidoreductase [Micromonospora sp. WMMD961]
MSKTVAIFGAGTGLGLSVARRFGREGYRVALVGRRPDALDRLVAELTTDGIEAAAFPADLTRTAEVPALLAAITARYGGIDVVEYAPITTAPFIPAAELTPEVAQGFVKLYLLTPLEIVRQVLPAMIERGDGGILITQGATAVNPAPFMSGVGPAMAAARNYLHSLHGEVAGKGVYVGTLMVNAMILGSAGHRAMTAGELGVHMPQGIEIPTVDPVDLADLLWKLLVTRDRVEVVHPDVDHGSAV